MCQSLFFNKVEGPATEDKNNIVYDINSSNCQEVHCVKSVQIRTRKNSVFEHFSRSKTYFSESK